MARSVDHLQPELWICADPHELCKDICTIVKGCVFEWCLSDGRIDVEEALLRILKRYLKVFETK